MSNYNVQVIDIGKYQNLLRLQIIIIHNASINNHIHSQ